ncbi:Na+/proline symporter [Sphingomonas sp. YR710]|uniref:hypothetical protein n=1 Tax=Sphingomonas sp. YR710 TaxID=1882773 RepID=UPI000883F212|nr:hypothetical protein [Sphingomonas sp. YR710]SDD85124.1 Na+/proline symporter [Sphingomonas sp. YR710]
MHDQLVATIVFFIAGLATLVCLVDAKVWNKQRPTLARFFLVDGKLELPGYISAIVAANFSIGNFIVFIAVWGYSYGWAGLIAFFANLSLNAVGYFIFMPHFKTYIEDRTNSGTIHEFIADIFSKHDSITARYIRVSASVVTVVCLLLGIVFEISLAVDLLAVDPVGKFKLYCSFAIMIALFSAYGGFRTLIASDIANSVVMIAAIAATFGLIWTYSPSDGPSVFPGGITLASFQSLGWPAMLSIAVIGTGWMLVAMDQWQRSCASRNASVSFKGVVVCSAVLAVCAVCYAMWGGFAAHILPNIISAEAAKHLSGAANPLLDMQYLPANGLVARIAIGLAVSGLIFAAISTANTFLNVCAHSLTSDVLLGSAIGKSISEISNERSIELARFARILIIGLVAFVIIVYAICVSFRVLTDPLSFFYITYSTQFALLSPIAMCFLPKVKRPSPLFAIASIWIGFLVSFAVGISAWVAMQAGSKGTMGLAPGDWLTLAPVAAVVIGALPLLAGVRYRAK